MTQTCTSTQNDVIRYVYNETTPSENLIIEESILHDNDLLSFYLNCIDLKEGLNKVKVSPSETSTSKILEFSRNYQPVI